MTTLISGLLRRRARSDGAEPLLTWYEPATGARTELSAVTLLNWVDKTAHLLAELSVAPGEVVGLPLATSAPGHWVTAVWELACWQVGAVVVPAAAPDAVLVVSGPDWAPFLAAGPDVVACSLHPLGLPLGGELPSPVLDYALEVRGQADVYPAVPQHPQSPAWRDDERSLDQAALVAGPRPPRARRLVRPSTAWASAYAVVLTPLLGGGSTVVVSGPVEDDQLDRIGRDERVEVPAP